MTNPILDMLSKKSTAPQQDIPTDINDSRLDPAKAYVASHGGDPKTAFYTLCKERGIDPEPIVRMVFGNR